MEKGQKAKKKKRNSNDTEEEKNPFSKLPSDILLDIFSRIPAKSLFDSRWVCKSWFNLVHDPCLAKMHLTRASQNGNPSIIFGTYGQLYLLDNIEESNVPIMLKFPFMGSDPYFWLVGSCNGLVCVRDTLGTNIYIFNPVTREYVKLPEPNIKPITGGSQFSFCYHPLSNEYKVLRLVIGYRVKQAEIYTLSSNSWRKIYSTKKIGCYESSGSVVNGAIHWRDSPIISFDVGEEEFRVVEHPTELPPDISRYDMHLGVLGGCLSLSYSYPYDQNISVVWVMKQYGVKESWTKQLFIEETELLET